MNADDGGGGAKLSTTEWARVWEIFQAAAALPPPQREDFVRSSGAPVEVTDRVLVLLAENEQEVEAPPPAPGRQYGRYTLVKLLGAGGMGEVYSAHDSELDRQVALKFLGAKAKLLPSSVERLVREAQAASALNHPNLITVFDVLHFEAGTALVTELVDGQPIRSLCGRVHPVRDVAAWGAQVARGLAAAHGQGIIHGDIKPENVMVRADGYVKVLDFGLAQREGQLGGIEGIPLGTLGYMSPEQTSGGTLSGASDVFSLGVMLLELSSGRHPFLESTAASTTQAILHRQPDMPEPTGTGDREFIQLLGAMLRKNPGDRPGASEVAAKLEAIAGRDRRRVTPRKIAWAVGALLLLLGAAAVAIGLRGREDSIVAGSPYALTSYSGIESQPAFSPDGSRIVFVWSGPEDDNQDIYVRSVTERGDLRRLTTDPRAEFSPAWSPDGAWIAYQRRATDGGDSQVLVAPAAGGPERVVGGVVDPMGYRGMAWWPDSQSLIVRDAVGQGRPLVRLFIQDGRKQNLTVSLGTQDFRPTVSPDGQSAAFLRQERDRRLVCRVGLADRRESCLEWKGKANSIAWYGDSSHLLLGDPQGLWAMRLETDGHGSVPTRLQQGAFVELATDRPVRHVAFARNYSDLNIWRLDVASGRSTRIVMSSEEDSDADYSPDGRRIVFRSKRTGRYELYTSDTDGANVRQLTSLRSDCGSARWSPDAKWIAFDASDVAHAGSGIRTTVSSLYLIPAAGGAVRQLTGDKTETMVPNWSRDGKWIYYMEDPGGHRETWKIAVDGEEKTRVSQGEMFDVTESADARWLYYSRPASAHGVWRRAAEGGPEELVKGTEDLVFRAFDLRGNQLYYLRAGPQPGFVVKDLETGAIRRLGPPPARVFNGPRVLAASPDGRSLLYVQEDLSLGDLMMLDLGGSAGFQK